LAPEHWGKGYASEAARAVQKVGRQHLLDISLIGFIRKENEASIRLALAIGATFETWVPFRGTVSI